ncbi:hypothetical protein Csa_012934 [Cucumis sativus]|uniref:Uncharacterized protein n=1 Tax=Cucumis sativus TaxID=3659 RepID=A0A0A0L1E6_CUCSA|nr:hypothetical protein Csa_012934 [Cucumis sativus]
MCEKVNKREEKRRGNDGGWDWQRTARSSVRRRSRSRSRSRGSQGGGEAEGKDKGGNQEGIGDEKLGHLKRIGLIWKEKRKVERD